MSSLPFTEVELDTYPAKTPPMSFLALEALL